MPKVVDGLVEAGGKSCGWFVGLYAVSTSSRLLVIEQSKLYLSYTQLVGFYLGFFNKRFEQFNNGEVGLCARFPQSLLELQANKY